MGKSYVELLAAKPVGCCQIVRAISMVHWRTDVRRIVRNPARATISTPQLSASIQVAYLPTSYTLSSCASCGSPLQKGERPDEEAKAVTAWTHQ